MDSTDRAKRSSILVVDDTPDVLAHVSEFLKDDYKLYAAREGPRALELAASVRPDLVLLDVMMPDMDGYEVCARLKANPATVDIPVIFLTSMESADEEARGLGIGAVDYLTKPINPPVLRARVATHLKLREARKALSEQNLLLETELAKRVAEIDRIHAAQLEIQRKATAAQMSLNQAASSFVPYGFLDALGKAFITEVAPGDCVDKDLTVLFTDIRSFTKISEGLTSRGVFEFINRYLDIAVRIILGNRGFIDKFIGDAIMGVFAYSTDDAVRSVVELHRALATLDTGLAEPIRIGVGINHGSVTLGTIGAPQRMDTTVMGDAVNLASRLESATKVYGISILLSESARDNLKEPSRFRMREVDTVKVKGKSRPIRLYEVFDVDPPEVADLKERTLADFEEGLALYRAGDFAGADARFRACKDIHPGDALLDVYIRRCGTLMRIPPGPDWAGVSGL